MPPAEAKPRGDAEPCSSVAVWIFRTIFRDPFEPSIVAALQCQLVFVKVIGMLTKLAAMCLSRSPFTPSFR